MNWDNVDKQSFDVGMASQIAYGYGCRLDGNMYIIAVCQNCTRRAEAIGHLIYVGNYIP